MKLVSDFTVNENTCVVSGNRLRHGLKRTTRTAVQDGHVGDSVGIECDVRKLAAGEKRLRVRLLEDEKTR